MNFFKTLIRIKFTNPKIIHCFLPQSYIFGGLIGLLLKKNVIMSRRSLNLYQEKYKFIPVKKIEKFLHKHSKFIIGNSKAVYNDLIQEGVDRNKLKTIYNGVIKNDYKIFNANKIKKSISSDLGNKFIFSSIANLIPYKNQMLIIKAAEKLKSVTNEFRVLLVGSGEDYYKKRLKLEIVKRKLKKNFIFIDQTYDIEKFYYLTDVGISSSTQEGFSNTILEFLNFGKPVIATKVGGNVEVINKTNGILIENDNPNELFLAMKRMIENKKDLKSLQEGAKKEIKKYNFEKMVKEYEKIYDKI